MTFYREKESKLKTLGNKTILKKNNNIKLLDDNELVKEIIKNNDPNLFSILYDRYAEVVYNRCLMFVKSRAEAQDLTHDIFIKLFIKLRTFKGTSKFSSWLYSFVYNFCVNYVTRDKHRKNEFVVEEEILTNLDITDESNEYSDADIFQLKSEKLIKALEIIEPEEKRLLLLKYQDDFTIKELQDVLEIGESAVKMRLKRAKMKLVHIYNEL